MDIPPYLISSALSLVVAQRLVRRVCEHCAVESAPPADIADSLEFELPESALWRTGEGCEHCGGTGYHGRMGLYEVMHVTEEMGEVLHPGASARDVSRVAGEQGLRTLWDHGLTVAAQGKTTLAEVARVLSGTAAWTSG